MRSRMERKVAGKAAACDGLRIEDDQPVAGCPVVVPGAFDKAATDFADILATTVKSHVHPAIAAAAGVRDKGVTFVGQAGINGCAADERALVEGDDVAVCRRGRWLD